MYEFDFSKIWVMVSFIFFFCKINGFESVKFLNPFFAKTRVLSKFFIVAFGIVYLSEVNFVSSYTQITLMSLVSLLSINVKQFTV